MTNFANLSDRHEEANRAAVVLKEMYTHPLKQARCWRDTNLGNLLFGAAYGEWSVPPYEGYIHRMGYQLELLVDDAELLVDGDEDHPVSYWRCR
jgi:hypothetical protein